MSRPRIHADANARVAASLAALEAAGGQRRTFRLSPDAAAALDQLRDLGLFASDTEAVCSAIISAARKLQRR